MDLAMGGAWMLVELFPVFLVTVVGLMIVFLALCAVMRGIALVLSYDFHKIFTREE